MNDEAIVRLAEFETETSATLALAVLEDAGIKAMLSGLEPSALGRGLGGDEVLEIFVPQGDLAKAQQLLGEIEAADEEEEIPAWTCPCGEEVDAGFFVCWSCGAEYRA